MKYEEFLATKYKTLEPAGFESPSLPPSLFPFQRDLTDWAVRLGRAAIFAQTGLGKSRMQVSWAVAVHEKTGGDVLILAPLAVAAQTVREAASIGVTVTLCREVEDVRPGLNITNYDRLHRFNTSRFIGVVLDESSILKSFDGKTRTYLIEAFSQTRYRLACTATPSPNDFTELGNHAEFLGVCTRTEMLSEYFVHDSSDTATWRLKGHARGAFWRWVSGWAALVRKPSDLSYPDDGYDLPPLHVHEHMLPVDQAEVFATGVLFPQLAHGLTEQRNARRASLSKRVSACAELVNADDEQWLIWGELNAETEALAKLIPGSVEVRGPDDPDDKERRLLDFAEARTRVLITKCSIAGWGLNLQSCSHMAFVGVSNSFEAYFQATRRCWRFRQTRPVHVHLFASESEKAVLDNLKRKEEEAVHMGDELSRETCEAMRSNVLRGARQRSTPAGNSVFRIPTWMAS